MASFAIFSKSEFLFGREYGLYETKWKIGSLIKKLITSVSKILWWPKL